MKKMFVGLVLSLSSCLAFQALAQQPSPQKPAPAALLKTAANDSNNVSTPGAEGGTCSATSEDGKKACSISCAKGKSAICSNTKTEASCRCSQ